MLKDKKKLTAKVESLTRKVQGLQNKLAATKGQAPGPSVKKDDISPPPKVVSPSPIPPVPLSNPAPSVPNYDPMTPISRPKSNRVVSGSAPLSKTPELRQSQPAVFRARTPEKHVMPTATPVAGINVQASTSTSSVGKKRARPDEFDDVSVPVQALYAEQERENATPRLRRTALQSVQVTGFTPVRRTKPRASQGGTSPGRRATLGTAGIADVTNSPRSTVSQTAKVGKRSWLGKIRGVSSNSQTASRTPSSRHGVFERAPGS